MSLSDAPFSADDDADDVARDEVVTSCDVARDEFVASCDVAGISGASTTNRDVTVPNIEISRRIEIFMTAICDGRKTAITLHIQDEYATQLKSMGILIIWRISSKNMFQSI